MCRAIVENVLSGTKAGFKATRNLVFNQKAERSTMKRQKSRGIVENVLSGTKAGIKSILNLVFNQKAERKKMDNQKSSSKFSTTLLTFILAMFALGVSPAAAQKYVTDPSTGKEVEAPRYGGKLTYGLRGREGRGSDAVVNGGAGLLLLQGVLEKPAIANWAEEPGRHGAFYADRLCRRLVYYFHQES